PHQLSGGMCQRVLIAMAFASDPRLVIADEPTTALDVTMHPPIIRLIADMQREHGTAVIFITPDLRLAARPLADVILLPAGRAVERGPARAVRASPAHPYTRCLQLANPSMSERRALYVIPDQMPSLRQLGRMSGCHFAPRCPVALDDCRRSAPPNVAVGDDHVVACVRAAATREIVVREAPTASSTFSERPLLEVDGLAKRYAVGSGLFRSREMSAVKAASFTIAENEFVGLVGESGSGKSTIAKLLVGLEQPTSGRILLGGHDVTEVSAQARALRTAGIQMVFQDP